MKNPTKLLLCMTAVLLLISGCSRPAGQQTANELHFSLSGISDVIISYDEEPVTFHEASGDELIIKEYMTKNKRSYYARVKQNRSYIHISEGDKPFFKDGFSRRIEVYLPAGYQESLTVTTTDGNIDFSDVSLQLSLLRIDSTSGTIEIKDASAFDIHLSSTSGTLKLDSISADTIRLETTSGSVFCNELTGYVTYTSTSGNADIKSAAGSGSYRANNSGNLKVVYTEVTDDLYFYNKNDSIQLTLPEKLSFEFAATTKNGSVSTTFQECIAIDGRTMSGIVGTDPSVTVKTETNNGDIEVIQ